jgi:hypothetical protein
LGSLVKNHAILSKNSVIFKILSPIQLDIATEHFFFHIKIRFTLVLFRDALDCLNPIPVNIAFLPCRELAFAVKRRFGNRIFHGYGDFGVT